MMSPVIIAAPAWIGATLVWWQTPSPSSVTPSGNAEGAVPEALATYEGARERSGDVRQALLGSGLFRKSDPAALSRWSEQLTPLRLPPGRLVGARCDLGGRLYVIMSGKVEISLRRIGGAELALTVLGGYEILGGVSLFDPAACETRVTALTEVLLVPIERGQLLMWMAECSEFSNQMLRLYARRAQEMTDTLTDFAFADVSGRVASRLLLLRRRFGHRDGEVVRIVHDLTLEDLSRLVGAAPELIGDTLRYFEVRGWIRFDGTTVVIVDSQALASYRNPLP
ncbi:Crp/Fnr family transcriptional regulator [Mycobacterium sp.]|jgi:CRP/FNR family transcriptional regulator, cyclic AMP receptor protein|uniref:Crp/Fnr family transcriptional regulator n=1 Tax=Mycobacterium sp. TaxID=1785 RepID=UPI002C25BD83|nr:Crp/Fnr family transcriptional regulator [Mycobacterium sp.]HXB86983.1 Crp/Fnr family transcriptional regulator [Mycobacterium sp.]